MTILVDKNTFKHRDVQKPIIFPPNKTIFFGSKIVGKKIVEIKTIPVVKSNNISKKTYEFVGPICESTDKFTTIKGFQKLKEKDLVVMCDVGAYGMSLGSNYNVRPKPPELIIKGSKINIIKKRQKLKDLI